MENENRPVPTGKASPLKVVAVVACVLAAGAVMALTGQHRPRPCGCCPQFMETTPSGPASLPRVERIVAYYFHRQARCPICVSIESNAKEAIESGFPKQLKDGRLEWRSVNYEESGNEQYATDYKIAAPCLVLARMKCGETVEWRNLSEVQELVGDKSALIQVVQRNVQEFLDYIAISGACCT
jgi:hypothetical protein